MFEKHKCPHGAKFKRVAYNYDNEVSNWWFNKLVRVIVFLLSLMTK